MRKKPALNGRRRKAFIAVIVLSFAVAAALVFRFAASESAAGKPDEVSVWTLFFDEAPQRAVEAEFPNFTDRFPGWTVNHRALPYRDLDRDFRSALASGGVPDILTITNPAEFAQDVFHEDPVPWSGNLWVLYYSKTHLSSLLGEKPVAPSNYAELLELFGRIEKAGRRPVALGASHGWPLTSLVQHIAGAAGSPGGDGTLARDIAAGTVTPGDSRMIPVFEELRMWRSRGWLASGSAEEPWTAGVRDVIAGTAAFTLLNRQFFDALPPENHPDIAFFPFPADWAVGSFIYLARPSAQPDRPAVREFRNFLLSAGVVDRLEGALALPFFGGVRDDALPARIIPSVTGNLTGSYHRELWYAAREAVR